MKPNRLPKIVMNESTRKEVSEMGFVNKEQKLGNVLCETELQLDSMQLERTHPALKQESVESRSHDSTGQMVYMRPGNLATWKAVFAVVIWEGGSAFDAWLTSSSVQVAQVLLTLPYSFAQLGVVSGITFQIFYGFVGCWTCFMITSLYADYRSALEKKNLSSKDHTIQWYEVLGGLLGPWWKAAGLLVNTIYLFCLAIIQLIACGSTVYYINDTLSKRTWTLIFGAFFILTVFIPTAYNYRMWSLVGILMTTYTAWYLTISAATNGQITGVKHSAPSGLVPYFTGATNLLFTFGGHSVTVEIMHAMWRPRQFKLVYLYTVLYIFSLTIPSASSMYWAFGDLLLHNSNAFGVLPKNKFRDAAVVLMLIHQFIEFGLLCLPVHLMWEKVLGVHHSKYFILRAAARIPVALAMWFVSLMIPFFGPINSAVGSLLVTCSVYIIPCAAHMTFYRSAHNRQNAIEQPPSWIRSWTTMYIINLLIVIWVVIIGLGFGSWASISNIVQQVHTFGLFAKCYQCQKTS
ncbi:hypothetical protein O6H91_20G053500 [Diphasiastrum complanatum]|uniref:Uncharacterized protein n=1 Tax=Diphasiastrum complanatum TaxID=34168 RepID=A0ACC2AQA8_DIPCM|nr:hypothetical protein O6H91_20G053500 [Diphasiastrum complanatum]